jgi:hypothetical protein
MLPADDVICEAISEELGGWLTLRPASEVKVLLPVKLPIQPRADVALGLCGQSYIPKHETLHSEFAHVHRYYAQLIMSRNVQVAAQRSSALTAQGYCQGMGHMRTKPVNNAGIVLEKISNQSAAGLGVYVVTGSAVFCSVGYKICLSFQRLKCGRTVGIINLSRRLRVPASPITLLV